ncbi:unnamed protein product [Protopolystoma xenopodis]|uniref:Uncharacterized protein n=1 Tax=Protopolystoma xenopodis TaxID=117903 RepID=A0A448WPF6_9PLAT|nr:unnamed protein product [Protopolystoma xenopodis]
MIAVPTGHGGLVCGTQRVDSTRLLLASVTNFISINTILPVHSPRKWVQMVPYERFVAVTSRMPTLGGRGFQHISSPCRWSAPPKARADESSPHRKCRICLVAPFR